MKHLIIKCKSPWFRSVLAITLVTLAAFFLVFSRQQTAAVSPLFPTYTTGSFTFTTPQELTGHPQPPVQIFFQGDGEPEIKVDIFGNIYVTAIQGVPGGTDLWKSINNGTSFVYMGQPDGAQDHCQTILQCAAPGGGDDSIDVSPGGYLYVSSLWLGNVTMSTSYDGGTGGVQPGQKWEVHPAAAGVPGDDRQWVAAYGPQTINMTYAANSGVEELGLFFVKSTDGGKTYGAPVEITGGIALNSVNVEGNLVVDPYNGNLYTAYIPSTGNNVLNLARSTDGGATWTVTTAYTGPAGTTNRGVFPILAVDRGGNLHLAFTKSDDNANHTNCHVFLTSTANPAAATPTWTSAVQIDNNGAATNTAVMPWIVGGSPGIVDVTWVGSSGTSPNTTPFDWHVYFAQVANALTGSPTIAQNQVETAVIHQHSICFDGGGCAQNVNMNPPHTEPGNRDMLEYYTMTIDAGGNANIAYSDTLNNCNQDPNTTPFCQSNAWFTKQTAGPSAYSPPAAPAPATFAAGVNAGGGDGHAEPNSWVDSHNCIYGGAIDGSTCQDYISKNGGLTFTQHTVTVGSGSHGGDFDIITVPQVGGARPDMIYTADLGITTVHIGKSTDGGNTYFQPGTSGSAGEVSASSDRMWLAQERIGSDQWVYLMDHEFVSEDIRFSASANDMVWGTTTGIAEPELIGSTNANTNPGPIFVDKTGAHTIYGVFAASTNQQNSQNPPFGTLLNIWDAVGPPPTMAMAGALPGPFVNHPVFKGLVPSPTTPAPPAGSTTFGTNVANIFPAGDSDSAGNVYVAWAMNSTRTNEYSIWLASSHDHGQTFYGPWRVSQGTGTCVFPWLAAGDNGRVDITWYQSSTVGNPNTIDLSATWNVMFGQSLNANTREPVFSVVTASDHIIHKGTICTAGLFGCPPIGTADRDSMLDFFEVAIGPDGLANIFDADNDSTGTGTPHVNFLRQNGGPLALTNPSAVTCLPPPPQPTDVVSHKIHGASFVGDIHLLPPNPGIEMRRNTSTDVTPAPNAGRDHELIITFPVAVTLDTNVTVKTNNPSDTPTGNVVAGNGTAVITVDLHNIQNPRRVTVTLNNVADTMGHGPGPVNVLMGVLLGDVNSNALVNSTDTSIVQSQSGQALSGSNFRSDVNVNGLINSTDTSIVQSKSGTGLP